MATAEQQLETNCFVIGYSPTERPADVLARPEIEKLIKQRPRRKTSTQ